MSLPAAELRFVFPILREIGEQIRTDLLQNNNIHSQVKSDNSLVTKLDLVSEDMLISALQRSYPEYEILSEEAGSLPARGKSKGKWIIDPIDGSRNLAHRIPHFCISVALERNGQIEYSIVYDPLRDEEYVGHRENKRTTYKNDRGHPQGAHTSKATDLEGCVLAIDLNHFSEQYKPSLGGFVTDLIDNKISLRQSGSSSLDFAYLATGKYDALLLPHAQLWDIAAGSLLVHGAGGIITDHLGDSSIQNGSSILASGTNKLHGKLLEITQKWFSAELDNS